MGKYDSASGSYVLMDGTNGLQDLSNQEFANDLVSGQYRVTIEPTDWECSVNSVDSGIGITKVIVVPQNDDLIITNGPLIDVSETTLLMAQSQSVMLVALVSYI